MMYDKYKNSYIEIDREKLSEIAISMGDKIQLVKLGNRYGQHRKYLFVDKNKSIDRWSVVIYIYTPILNPKNKIKSDIKYGESMILLNPLFAHLLEKENCNEEK